MPKADQHGSVAAHVLEYGAVRRHVLMGVLRELGAPLQRSGDPLDQPSGS